MSQRKAECRDCRDVLNPTEPRPFVNVEQAAFHRQHFGHHDVRCPHGVRLPHECKECIYGD